MGNIVVTEFISLDGIVEDPVGAEPGSPADWTAFDRGVRPTARGTWFLSDRAYRRGHRPDVVRGGGRTERAALR